MKVEGFIAGRLRFKGRMAVVAIAISFFIMIISVAISSGFSHELRSAISRMTGDIVVSNTPLGTEGVSDPLEDWPALAEKSSEFPGVVAAAPAVYRAGIIKDGDEIFGAMFKGTPQDTASLEIRLPSDLAASLHKQAGDEILAYFISDRVKVRRLRIASVYDNNIDTGDNSIIYLPIGDLQRLNGWEAGEASALELTLDGRRRSRMELRETR